MIERKLCVLALALLPLAACSSNKVTSQVKLEKSDYPAQIGEDASAYETAVFVKKRTDFAMQLWQQERLDDCIVVLADLVKNIPSSNRNRYDLGMMYYQRALPHIKEHRRLSQKITTLATSEKLKERDEAQDYTPQLTEAYNKLKADCGLALEQFFIYSARVPQDPRPVDMMWKCQIPLGQYADAMDNVERLLNWDGAIDRKSRQFYIIVYKSLKEYLTETNLGQGRGLVSPGQAINPTTLGPSNRR